MPRLIPPIATLTCARCGKRPTPRLGRGYSWACPDGCSKRRYHSVVGWNAAQRWLAAAVEVCAHCHREGCLAGENACDAFGCAPPVLVARYLADAAKDEADAALVAVARHPLVRHPALLPLKEGTP